MPREKEGYSYVSIQVPTVLYRWLVDEAERTGVPMAAIVTDWLRRKAGVPADQLPPRGKPGRPGGKKKGDV